MMRIAMSPAASGLLRALIARGECPKDRVLLTEISSVEWQSLTFVGERHLLHLRVSGPDAALAAARIAADLEDAEFTVPGQIVADVRCIGVPEAHADGSYTLQIEALTVEE